MSINPMHFRDDGKLCDEPFANSTTEHSRNNMTLHHSEN